MRFAMILVATAATTSWTTTTLIADQHGHAPVRHTTQAHGTPTAPSPGGTTTGATTPSTRTGGTHHEGDRHSSTHTPPSPIATKIQSHPQLAAKVTAMLPQRMTMNQAARGFKNQGQFIAALHASQRTGIPFADLKREMVREHESLGQAIHELRPSANGSREAEHAEHDADHDLGGSHSGTGGTTSGGTTGGTATGGTTTGTTTGTTPTTTRKHGK